MRLMLDLSSLNLILRLIWFSVFLLKCKKIQKIAYAKSRTALLIKRYYNINFLVKGYLAKEEKIKAA